MLSSLYFFIFIYLFILIFFFNLAYSYVRLSSYVFFIIYFIIALYFLITFNKSVFWYQNLFILYRISFLQIISIIGLDGLSIFFIILCAFLLMFCFLIYWYLNYKLNLYTFFLLIALWLLLNIFSSLDFFLFYIFFEGIIIPMFFLISIWGSRSRKIYAAYQFFLYTLIGSVFILLCFLSIYFNIGSSFFDFFLNSYFFTNRQLIFWIFMFLGFAVKIPMFPVHIWLPEAHVEAPTPGSVILAGILLKLGSYALLRLLFCFLFFINQDVIFFILLLAFISLLFASLIAFNQIDIKKIIAYSSIAHMNFSLLGLFSESFLGLTGMFYLMFGHAVTSGALFLCIGVLYDRYKTRLIFYYGSLVFFMPLFAILSFIFILSNFGFPGTANFVGEFLILVGGYNFSNTIFFLSIVSLVLTLVYSLFYFNKIFFGSFQKNFIRYYCEAIRLEFIILVIFCFFVILLGVYPLLILDYSLTSLLKLFINVF